MPSRSDSVKPVKIFLSYSPKDEKQKNQLESHLKLMERQGCFRIWDEQKILAGENKEKEIAKHFEEANIILCLISPDFISSNSYDLIESPSTLARIKSGEVKVIPILLKDVDWQETLFGKLGLQVIPRDYKPITRAYNRGTTLKEVAKEIARVIGIINGKNV
ncbi:MAG TPA: toll/interleukin-1 receptor domain-containing protein [Ktedonosporobacter sp.]|jgi:hypothetical protein|nr:toll/interleukin-1 receptor domain-containing protein [Ktedonosporobacter sp.]